MKLDRIVVGTDGSAGGHRAVVCAADLAALSGGELVCVHARGLLDRLHGSDRADAAGEELLREGASIGLAVPPRLVVQDGNPVSVVLDVAEREHADVIVVGSRGLGGHPELLLGSTSTQIAQRATCPVLIVPASSRTFDPAP